MIKPSVSFHNCLAPIPPLITQTPRSFSRACVLFKDAGAGEWMGGDMKEGVEQRRKRYIMVALPFYVVENFDKSEPH